MKEITAKEVKSLIATFEAIGESKSVEITDRAKLRMYLYQYGKEKRFMTRTNGKYLEITRIS